MSSSTRIVARTEAVPLVRPERRPSTFRALMRKPLGAASLVFLVLLVTVAVAAPLLAPYDPLATDLRNTLQGPSATHLLGTDSLGQDVLSRLIFGARESLTGVLEAVMAWLVIGVPIGVAAGYLGGRFDRAVNRVVDISLAIPGIIVTLTVLAIFSSSMFAAMISLGVLGAAVLIRVVRGRVLSIREELYIDAAHVMGLSTPQILVRHVLPRTMGVIIVQLALFCAITLGTQAGLAFLGFGPPPPAPTWGGMVSEGMTMFQRQPWLLVPPGVAIAIATMAFGLLGDAVRDVYAERSASSSSARRPVKRRGPRPIASGVDSAAPSDFLLDVRGLSIAFADSRGDETTVVDDVSFRIAAGSTVGLVGESGSGKTVTALSILGLLPKAARQTTGSVWFDGINLSTLSPAQLARHRGSGIAMISQEPMVALDPSFRVGSQLAEVVRVHDRCSRRQAHRRVIELLEQVRLPDPEGTARKYPHQISGGMAQRIAIAAALAGRPKLLIADEPTTALDVTVQAGILDLLVSLQEETGMAIVLVTHDWGVVADVCSEAVVMYAGQVVERARVDQIFSRPGHPYTLGLLRSNPHRAVKGEPLPAIAGTVPSPQQWPHGCRFAPRCRFAQLACTEAVIPEATWAAERTSRCIRRAEIAPEMAELCRS